MGYYRIPKKNQKNVWEEKDPWESLELDGRVLSEGMMQIAPRQEGISTQDRRFEEVDWGGYGPEKGRSAIEEGEGKGEGAEITRGTTEN